MRDAQFRKQMGAVNRRYDLFQRQQRSGTLRYNRRPIVVQRAIMPEGTVRKVMTLSVSSCGGINQVGFEPSSTSVQGNGVEASPTTLGQSFGKKVGEQLKKESASLKRNNLDCTNLLAAAAAEAGLTVANDPSAVIPHKSCDGPASDTCLPSPAADDSLSMTALPPASDSATTMKGNGTHNHSSRNDSVQSPAPSTSTSSANNPNSSPPPIPPPPKDNRHVDDTEDVEGHVPCASATPSCNLDIQPPTPNMDSLLDSFSFLSESKLHHDVFEKVCINSLYQNNSCMLMPLGCLLFR